MTEFENNNIALIEKKIREISKPPKVGIVKRVYEHRASDDDSNFEVNVRIDAGTVPDLQRVPVHNPSSGTISVPKVGDKVLIYYEDGSQKTPVAMGIGWSNKDRPPLGRVGMYRNRFESNDSPLGKGDLHLTGYTSYDDDPNTSDSDKRDVTAEEAFIQIAKHVEGDNVNLDDPSNPDIPFKFEVYDSPKNNEGHATIEINGFGGSDSDATWGMKFDFSDGTFQIVDPDGYGIEAKGNGEFEWHHKDINFNETTGGGPLDL